MEEQQQEGLWQKGPVVKELRDEKPIKQPPQQEEHLPEGPVEEQQREEGAMEQLPWQEDPVTEQQREERPEEQLSRPEGSVAEQSVSEQQREDGPMEQPQQEGPVGDQQQREEDLMTVAENGEWPAWIRRPRSGLGDSDSGPGVFDSGVGASDIASSLIVLQRGPRGRFMQTSFDEAEASARPSKKRKDKDQSWVLTDAAPGGPTRPTLIPSFGGHVAHRLWIDPQVDRGVIQCYTRDRHLTQLKEYDFFHDGAEEMVVASGLIHLRDCMIRHLDLPLLAAFVERWQPDTNTFHMPFGEMSILLHDVYYILRIPVDGEVLSGTTDSAQLKADMCALLERRPEELSQPVDPASGKKAPWYKSGGVLAEHLMGAVREGRDASTEAHAYLLFLLGSTLFVDKSGDRIRAAVNVYLKDLTSVQGYAWGAGALAYLYRQLGVATRADAKGICGCMTLLQAWIYEYFPTLRPMRCQARTLAADQPRALRWDTRGGGGVSNVGRLKHYRLLLDNLTADQVMWLPYGTNPGQRVARSLYCGCLRFGDVAEYYDPSRSLRQFGYKQIIPCNPPPPTDAFRPSSAASYDVRFPDLFDHLWRNFVCHSLSLDKVSVVAQPLHAVADDYVQWYRSVSHSVIVNPGSIAERQESGVAPEMIVDRLAPLLQPRDARPAADIVNKLLDDAKSLFDEYMRHGPRRPAPE